MLQDRLQQLTDGAVFFDLVPQVRIGVDHIMNAAPFFLPLDDPGLFELDNQSMRGAFGNADTLRDVPKPRLRVFSEAYENMRIVAEERPVVWLCRDSPILAAEGG